MDFEELINKRHSVRSYKSEEISDSVLDKLIEMAKLAPTSRNKKPVEYVIVKDKETMDRLSQAKAAGSQMIKDAGAAIVVTGDSDKSDVWIEDCSIAMTYLHLAAVNLGLGSCWVQIRKRQSKDGTDSGKYIKDLLNIRENMEVLAVLSLGVSN